MRRRLSRHLGCEDLASECLHDVWLRLAGMHDMPYIHHLDAYVYRMACNVAIDRLRSERTGRYLAEAEAFLDGLADAAPGPEAVAEWRSEVAALDRVLGGLPVRQRSILMSLRLEEKTRQEAAAYHGLSLRSVDTALRQALDWCGQGIGRAASRALGA